VSLRGIAGHLAEQSKCGLMPPCTGPQAAVLECSHSSLQSVASDAPGRYSLVGGTLQTCLLPPSAAGYNEQEPGYPHQAMY
jgi:hypothetical protein